MTSHSVKTSLFDTYRYREVLYRLLSRDLKIKYKRTFFGYFWSLLNPILQLTVLSIVFSNAMRIGMKEYTLYLFAGLLPWTFFQSSLVMSATSIWENEHFIKKIYLPKLIFPLSRLLLRLIDFCFSLVALLILGAILSYSLKPTMAFLPMAMTSLVLFTLGLGILLSVANVYFRDVEYLLGVFLQLFYFATPIIYPPEILPQQYQWIVNYNPFYTQVLLFQKLIYFGTMPTAAEWGTALCSAVFVFGFGLFTLAKLDEDLIFRM